MQVDVLESAQRAGMSMGAVEFSGDVLKNMPSVWRQKVILPVQAPYPVLRAWLFKLLQYPTLSIDALDISRTDVRSDVVKARVVISLWWRHPMGESGVTPKARP